MLVSRVLWASKKVDKRLSPRIYRYARYGRRNPNTGRYWNRICEAEGRSPTRDYKVLHARILSYVPTHANMLDVGCGAGYLLAQLQCVSGISDAGVDFSSVGVQLCRRQGLVAGVADAYHLSFPDDQFEVVTCCELLEHLDHPPDALAEMFRVLRTSGLLLISVSDLAEGEVETTDEHVQQFSAETLRRLLGQSGRIIAIEQIRDHVVDLKQEQCLLTYVFSVMRERTPITRRGKFLIDQSNVMLSPPK